MTACVATFCAVAVRELVLMNRPPVAVAGVAYAGLASLAHLAGGGLHWLRCTLTRRDRGVAPRFLTTLLAHDARALLRGRPADPAPHAPGSVSNTQPQRSI